MGPYIALTLSYNPKYASKTVLVQMVYSEIKCAVKKMFFCDRQIFCKKASNWKKLTQCSSKLFYPRELKDLGENLGPETHTPAFRGSQDLLQWSPTAVSSKCLTSSTPPTRRSEWPDNLRGLSSPTYYGKHTKGPF